MLERSIDQATGLLALATPQGPRLMAMVNHGDEKFELPLLWRLCSALVGFGYPVTVLDATTCESEGNPGLEQLLEYDFWHSDPDGDSPQWKVIPAAFGLQSLGALQEHKSQSLQQLGQLFPHEGVLLIYGKAQWLTPLLSNSGIKPLLAVAPMKHSLVGGYVALKQLLLNGRIEPTIGNILADAPTVENVKLRPVASTLSACAKNFLGYEVNAVNIAASTENDALGIDMQHLALRMLENAIVLEPPISTATAQQAAIGPVHFTGSH